MKKKSKNRSNSRRLSYQCRFELLEGRRLLSGNSGVVSHISSATYSASSGADTVALAFDASRGTAWNSRAANSAWIQVDLGARHRIDKISLDIAQTPNGHTTHQIWISDNPIGNNTTDASLLKTLDGVTSNGQILEVSTPGIGRYVQIQTVMSPSWVAWRELQVSGHLEESPSPSNPVKRYTALRGVDANGIVPFVESSAIENVSGTVDVEGGYFNYAAVVGC